MGPGGLGWTLRVLCHAASILPCEVRAAPDLRCSQCRHADREDLPVCAGVDRAAHLDPAS